MQRHHAGSGRRTVIPTDWEAAHRPVAEKTHTSAQAAIRIPGGTQAWDNALEQNVEVPHPPYFDGGCRVQALAAQAGQPVVADDPESTAGFLITVSAAASPAEGHLITITNSGDPALDDKVLRIRQVIRGSLRFERDLICTHTD